MKKVLALALLFGASTTLAIAGETPKAPADQASPVVNVKPGEVPHPMGERENPMKKRLEEMLKEADTNGDHAVSAEEFSAYMQKQADERLQSLTPIRMVSCQNRSSRPVSATANVCLRCSTPTRTAKSTKPIFRSNVRQ